MKIMFLQGELRKMPTNLDDAANAHYDLLLVDTGEKKEYRMALNQYVGHRISFHFTGNIFCINCGRKIKKTFNQGFCYDCFVNAPEAAECIINPELCRAHLGEGRNPQWEEEHHNRPHYVYLAATDVVKVGVTRATQVPNRWIDQGAASAIKLAQTPNRYEAGLIEVGLKSVFTDKTNWRKMLTNQMDESIDLLETKWELVERLPRDLTQFITDEDAVTKIIYPVIQYPEKVSTINLDTTPNFKSKLLGIRGQYFLLEDNRVINLRKYAGYQAAIGIE